MARRRISLALVLAAIAASLVELLLLTSTRGPRSDLVIALGLLAPALLAASLVVPRPSALGWTLAGIALAAGLLAALGVDPVWLGALPFAALALAAAYVRGGAARWTMAALLAGFLIGRGLLPPSAIASPWPSIVVGATVGLALVAFLYFAVERPTVLARAGAAVAALATLATSTLFALFATTDLFEDVGAEFAAAMNSLGAASRIGLACLVLALGREDPSAQPAKAEEPAPA